MKVVNRTLIFIGCTLFALHFAILMIVLSVSYFFKFIYYKLAKKGEFKMNPFSHANPGVLSPTSNSPLTQ